MSDLVGTFKRLNPEPGDVFTLSFGSPLNEEQVDRVRSQLAAALLDGCKVLILHDGVELRPAGQDADIEACISRCPICERYGVDRVGVSRSGSCFDGHEAADYEVVTTIRGPLARVALDLNLIHGIQTDDEWLYDAKERTGAADLPEATGFLAVRALEQLIAASVQRSEGDQ